MKTKIIICLLLGMLLSGSGATNIFKMISVDLVPTGFVVRWNSTLGKTYAVMTTDNLMSNSWQIAVNGTNANYQSIVKAAADGELEYIDQDGITGTNRFYKLVAYDVPDKMVLIPGGMNSGTNYLVAGDIYYDWYPSSYSLTCAFFYMDRTEVTNDEMIRVMQWAYDNGKLIVSSISVKNAQGNQQELLDLDASYCRITWSGSTFGVKSTKGSGYPCVEVSWYGSLAYCNYRSEMDGRTPCYNLSDWSCNTSANGYRLPSSSEWEYAARGGLISKRFPWGDTIDHNKANYYSVWVNGSPMYSYDVNSTDGYHPAYYDGEYPYTSPVESFAPNGYGLYDMAGNVAEWCNTTSGVKRVVLGGNWFSYPNYVRCGREYSYNPISTDWSIGLRPICR